MGTNDQTMRVIVQRDSIEELTFARVEAVCDHRIRTAAQLRQALTHAVTQWMRQTAEGHHAFRSSRADFNVGDLAAQLPDDSLTPYLRSQGIEHLQIDADVNDAADRNWTYDTPLFDQTKLTDLSAQ